MTKKWSLLAIALIIIGFIGMAYHHFKFNEPLKDFQGSWDLNEQQLQHLTINGDFSTNVNFIPSPDGSSHVEISGKFKPEVFDKLNQTKPDADGLKLDLKSGSFKFFNLDFSSPKAEITVAVPDGFQVAQFQFNLGSGSSSIQGLRADNADLKMSSGNLSITDAKTDKLYVRSSSGNVTLDQIEAPIDIGISSGNFKGTGVSGQVQIKTVSGNITLNDFTGTGQMKAISGNVKLNGQRSDALDITTVSGSVKLSEDKAFQGFYDLKAVSGSVHAPNSPAQTNDVIKVRTTSGGITIK